MQEYPHFRALGSHAILLKWPSEISDVVLQDVLRSKKQLENLLDKPILYINNTYNSILINYGYAIDNINVEISYIKTIINSDFREVKIKNTHWQIPVCYDDNYALDINEISKENKLSKTEIIKLHSKTIYTVYFIGFLPGFLYLGGLDSRLYFNRKISPRLRVEKGAVGIGGQQTGIYPKSSPGGWNIIGNSPINFFNRKSKCPCFAKAGDTLEFKPITLEEHFDITAKVEANEFSIKPA